MIGLIALALTLNTYSLEATDDVWLYPHAYDQIDDPLLRIWGDGSASVGDVESSAFSFALVRFDLSSVKEKAGALKRAALVLYHDASANFTKKESEDGPLEVRMVNAAFDEKSWKLTMLPKHMPGAGKDAIVGSASMAPSSDGKPFRVEIDLLAGPADFKAALGGGAVAFALTSKKESGGQDGPYYKILARSAEKGFRPTLVLEYK